MKNPIEERYCNSATNYQLMDTESTGGILIQHGSYPLLYEESTGGVVILPQITSSWTRNPLEEY
jgi:hypothetical protein